jgi:hypothetical protein
MKSGQFDAEVSREYFHAAIADIHNHEFVQRTFHPRPALIVKELVNGHRMSKEFKGEIFDPNKFDKVEGHWDHEHCSICWFKIVEGYTYWENKDSVKLLCDACYEEYKKQS